MGTHSSIIEDSLIIYDPNNPPFEQLYLCEYLRELPDLEEEDNSKSGQHS